MMQVRRAGLYTGKEMPRDGRGYTRPGYRMERYAETKLRDSRGGVVAEGSEWGGSLLQSLNTLGWQNNRVAVHC